MSTKLENIEYVVDEKGKPKKVIISLDIFKNWQQILAEHDEKGYQAIVEKNLEEIWNNPFDEEEWQKYL